MKLPNHTKTPWKTSDEENLGYTAFRIVGDGVILADVMFNEKCPGVAPTKDVAWANAQFIVEAVNAHATITARVKELEEFVQDVAFPALSGFSRGAIAEKARELLPKEPKDVV